MASPTPLEWVTVKTTLPTLPLPLHGDRPPVRTERLILRPFQKTDTQALHELRLQPEVMMWTMQGKPDADLTATEKVVEFKMPPYDKENHDYAIIVAETNQLVGVGGSFKRDGELGWPVFGYMFRKEAWGKGYATEFVKAYTALWWELPRSETEVKVEKSTVIGEPGDDGLVPECLVAVTVVPNKGSQNVLNKAKFKLAKVWEEPDLHDASQMETLYGYAAMRPN